MFSKSSSTLSSCRQAFVRRPSSTTRALYSSVRANSTVAASPQNGDENQPKKRAVPRASSFGDIIIPSRTRRDAPVSGKGKDYVPGLGSLGHDEFDGVGNLASRLARMQSHPRNLGQVTVELSKSSNTARSELKVPKLYLPHSQQRSQNRQRSENADTFKTRETRREDGNRREASQRERRNDGRTGGMGASSTAERKPRQAGRPSVAAQSKPKSQAKKEFQGEKPATRFTLPMEATIETTDFQSLFGAPPTSSSLASPTLSSSHAAPIPIPEGSQSIVAHRVQLTLERVAGDYSRYCPGGPIKIKGDSLNTVGPSGYANFMLSHRPDVGLGMKKNAMAVVDKLVGQDAQVEARP